MKFHISCIIWNQGKLQISLKLGFVQGVDQAKKELVINELEKEEAQKFLPILIFLAYIYARIFVVPLLEKEIEICNYHLLKHN